VLTSNEKGNIAELAVALEATKLGVEVLKPLAEHGRYDLAFDLGHRILRVQCKNAKRRGDVLVISLVSSYACDGPRTARGRRYTLRRITPSLGP
jgi:PD-(D/E)XK endonuclease